MEDIRRYVERVAWRGIVISVPCKTVDERRYVMARKMGIFVTCMAALVVWSGICVGGGLEGYPGAAEVKKKMENLKGKEKALWEEVKACGGRIFFQAGGVVYRLDVKDEGLQPRKIFEGGSYPHVSPDGKKLVVQQWNSKVKPEEFAIKKFDKRYPLKERRMQRRVAILMDVDGKNVQPLCYLWDPHWALSDRYIVGNLNMKTGERPIVVIDLEKKEERAIVPRNWRRYRSRGFACVTPDGRWVCSGNPRFVAIPVTAGMVLDESRKVRTIVRSSGCNQEVSPDGKWFVWVIDTFGESGAWICHSKLNLEGKKVPGMTRSKLGWKFKSVNYDPDFSPDGKFLVYMHGECVPGKPSYGGIPSNLYVTHFPPDGVNVQITFFKNTCVRHPHWVK